MGCCNPLGLFELGLLYGLEAQQGRQLTPQVFVQVLPRPHEAATRLFKEALTKEVTEGVGDLANGAQTTPPVAANGSTGATFKDNNGWNVASLILHGISSMNLPL